MPSTSPRTALAVIAGAVAILGVTASPAGDEGTPLIVLLGPIVTGAIAARLRRPWTPVAAAWALSGFLMLVLDWILNGEDQIFHVVLAAVMAALTALGAALGGFRRHRAAVPGAPRVAE